MTPKRSAMAPAIGWPSPHSRFCSASARPKTSRPQVNSAAHRLDEKAEARARPKTQQRDRASADDDHQRRPPCRNARGWTKVAGRYSHTNTPAGQSNPRRSDLMHLHENPKGSGEKTSTAGQPCRIGEGNRCNLQDVAAVARMERPGYPISGCFRLVTVDREKPCKDRSFPFKVVPVRCKIFRSFPTGPDIRPGERSGYD